MTAQVSSSDGNDGVFSGELTVDATSGEIIDYGWPDLHDHSGSGGGGDVYYLQGTPIGGGPSGYYYPLYLTESEASGVQGAAGSHQHTFSEYPGVTFYMPTGVDFAHGATAMPDAASGLVAYSPDGGSMGDLSVSVKSWKGMTNLHGVDFGGGKMTGMDGLASFTKDSASPNMDFTPEWMMTTAEQEQADAAVDLQDAISILKMIVGLPINSSGAAVSPYQSIAADFDADGAVGLNDAIDVLKHVVDLPAVGQPKWDFVEAGVTVVDPLQPGQMAATMTRDVSAINTVELIGVLRGDVDGSWDDLVV